MKEFILKGIVSIDLVDFLKTVGYCRSNAEAREMILDGKIKINNRVEVNKRLQIQSGDVVELDGKKIVLKADKFFL